MKPQHLSIFTNPTALLASSASNHDMLDAEINLDESLLTTKDDRN
jgi:hypothetical protein